MHVPMNWLTRLGVLLRQLGMIFPKWAFCREKGLKHAHFHLQGLGAVVGDGTAPWLAWVRLVLASIADVRQKCTVNIKPVRPCSRARAARMTREAKTCRLIALRFAHSIDICNKPELLASVHFDAIRGGARATASRESDDLYLEFRPRYRD